MQQRPVVDAATLRLDALKYGLRCLDVMSRASASVAMPPRPASDRFDPSVTLRPIARDGAALSLRMFSEEDDATDWVLRRSDRLVWTPPRRAPRRSSRPSRRRR